MSKDYTQDLVRGEDQRGCESDGQNQATHHPVTLENSPAETIKRMRAFPERAAKLTEIIRDLREADAR